MTFIVVVADEVVTDTPPFIGVTTAVYVLIDSPPFDVGGVAITVAVVELPLGTVADAARGADGVDAAIPNVITAVPESTVPPAKVVMAVIVN